jgi:hypothetical protein
VPDDLLRFIIGPTPYSSTWLWLGLLLLLLVIAWYAGVFVWTLPSEQLRRSPLVRLLHARVLRRKFVRTIGSIGREYRAGDLSAQQAGARISSTLRSFLHQATGTRAQYMHVDDIGAGDLAEAAPLIARLNDVQFNTASKVDVAEACAATEELIRTWP